MKQLRAMDQEMTGLKRGQKEWPKEVELGEDSEGPNEVWTNFMDSGWTTEAEMEIKLLEEVVQFYNMEEQLGDDLPIAAANLENKALRSAMPPQREKDLFVEILRPKNCDSLAGPCVNQEIW